MPSPIEKEAETAPVVEKPVEKVAAAATATPVHKVIEKVEKAEAVSTTVGDNVQAENKAEDKKQSRSGRIIKRTKYVFSGCSPFCCALKNQHKPIKRVHILCACMIKGNSMTKSKIHPKRPSNGSGNRNFRQRFPQKSPKSRATIRV